MFAAHFAAGLALKGRAPRTPLPALLLGAFLLDLLWILFGVGGFDLRYTAWSHSLVMSIVWASLFSALFWRLGRSTVAALWVAVFSHFVLDLIVQGSVIYPPDHLLVRPFVTVHYRWLQLGICAVLLAIYVRDARRAGLAPRWIVATCATIVALNGRFLVG